jgi:hypothetical protein
MGTQAMTPPPRDEVKRMDVRTVECGDLTEVWLHLDEPHTTEREMILHVFDAKEGNPEGYARQVRILLDAALAAAVEAQREQDAVIAEELFDHRNPEKYPAYRRGDWTLEHENAGDKIASAIRAQGQVSKG